MNTIKQLNEYCILNGKRILVCRGKLKGFVPEKYELELLIGG